MTLFDFSKIGKYLDQIKKAVRGQEGQIQKVIDVIRAAKEKDSTIWTVGNGGSLCIAQHFAQDLVKLCGIRAQALSCAATLTAWTNDHGWDNACVSPLLTLRRMDDPVIIFSVSGASKNYEKLKDSGICPIIAFVGKDGGFLKEFSNIVVHVHSDDYQICETAFQVVCDLVLKGLIK